jgi:hypothetical protein
MSEKKFERSSSTGKGFGQINPQMGGAKQPGMKDLVEVFDWGTKKKYRPVRFVGPLHSVGLHKIKIKKKDGETIEITKPCLSWNAEKETRDSTVKCAYCQMGPQQRFTTKYFSNVIDRVAQEDKPSKAKPYSKEEVKAGFKDVGSESWSPIRVPGLPPSLAKRIKEINERNLVKDSKGNKKQYDIRDPKHGVDVEIKFDKDEQAANMYNAIKSDEGPTALTKDEQAYLLFNLSVLYAPEKKEIAEREAKSMAERAPDDIKKEIAKLKGSKSKKDSSSSDSSSDESGLDMSDDSSDDKKKSKKSSSKSSSKKPASKSKKDASSASSSDDSSSSSSDLSGGSDGSDQSSSSDSSQDNSNSASDKSSSSSSDSDEDKGSKKGSKSSSSKSKAKESKSKSKGSSSKSKAKSDSSDLSGSDSDSSGSSSDSSSDSSSSSSDSSSDASAASDSSSDKKKSSSKKSSSKSKKDASGSDGSDLSDLDSSGSDSSGSDDSDAKKKTSSKKSSSKSKSSSRKK